MKQAIPAFALIGLLFGAIFVQSGQANATIPAVPPTSSPTIHVNVHKVVISSTLPSCKYEDASGGPLPCSWNLNRASDGNGIGVAYYVTGTHRHEIFHAVWDVTPLRGHPNRMWIDSEMADALAEGDGDAGSRDWQACFVNYVVAYPHARVGCADGHRERW